MLFGIDHKQYWQTNKSYALNGEKQSLSLPFPIQGVIYGGLYGEGRRGWRGSRHRGRDGARRED